MYMNVDDDDEVFIISNRTRERSGLTHFLKYHHSSSSYSCVCSGRDVLPPNASNTKVCREDDDEEE